MRDILVLGAGKIGVLISGLLGDSGDYRVQLADAREGAAAEVAAGHGLDTIVPFDLDASDKAALEAHVKAHKPTAVVSGLPYFCNVIVAEVAREYGLHYFDLTEDVAVTEAVRKIAEGTDKVFAPQCGLAPGFISIAANELISHFDKLKAVKLRVGALPQHPNNVLKYSLTWSTDGVINEYGNLCNAIVDGAEVDVLPL
ncbi:MAG: saccharopine dehydrogenase NADP-binding domain-containing protein, partial [Pseudomonadota bacterium]